MFRTEELSATCRVLHGHLNVKYVCLNLAHFKITKKWKLLFINGRKFKSTILAAAKCLLMPKYENCINVLGDLCSKIMRSQRNK